MAKRRPTQPPARTARKVAVTGTLRIIGGRLRGRPIAYSGDLLTRPMKQRVREAAFNLVGPRVVGTHVIDLFAGTGALTWEALSRGASRATLIERHFPTARLIRENARTLGLADRIDLVPGDTFAWSVRLELGQSFDLGVMPWLVFCSPPYDLYVSQRQAMRELLLRLAGNAPPSSLIIVEADDRFDPGDLPTLFGWDIRNYPPAVLAVGQRYAPDCPSTPPL